MLQAPWYILEALQQEEADSDSEAGDAADGSGSGSEGSQGGTGGGGVGGSGRDGSKGEVCNGDAASLGNEFHDGTGGSGEQEPAAKRQRQASSPQ